MLTTRRNNNNEAIQLAQKLVRMGMNARAPSATTVAKGALAAGISQEIKKRVDGYFSSAKGKKGLRGSNSHRGNSSSMAPVSIGNSLTSYKAMTTPTASGVRIRYRELISSTVAGTTTFPTTFLPGSSVFQVNPGLPPMNPWLAPQSVQYEQYRYHGLKFIYIPFVNTSISGDVMMMMDYNVLDPPPSTEQQFLDHPGAKISSIWECSEFVCNIKSMHAIGPRKFVRPCAVAGDLKTYDCGKFYICSNNVAAGTAAIGKLFIEYDVEFFTPQLVPSPATLPSSTTMTVTTTPQTYTTSVAAPLNLDAPKFDPLGIYTGFTPGSSAATPPAGCYRISIVLQATAVTDLTQVQLAFYKNGASYVPQAFTWSGAGADLILNQTATGEVVVPLNGTDTFQFEVIISGAGTLAVTQSIVLWSLA